ncbi:MAG: PEP-CTERM sorting domain-containing protein [Betaproteobacteria bacterium]
MTNTNLALAVAAALITITPAHAYLLTADGHNVAGEGQYTNIAGATTYNFNDGLLPSGYAGGSVVLGSNGNSASPPGNTSYYLNEGPTYGSPTTIGFSSALSYFGFYYGSPDTYNSLQLFNGNSLLATFTGGDFAALINRSADGNQSIGEYVNIFAQSTGEQFNKVVLTSTGNALETDNHAVIAVPEPGTYAVLVAGLRMTAGMFHRRAAKSEFATTEF